MLGKQGRGAQSRLARQHKIDRGYLNSIIKGRKPGSDEIRAKIAEFFNLTYEDMLALGRSLLEPTPPLASEEDSSIGPAKQEEMSLRKEQTKDHLVVQEEQPSYGPDARYLDKTNKVTEILSSKNVYGEIMEGLIDIIHEASKENTENQALKKRIADLESRLNSLEKKYSNS